MKISLANIIATTEKRVVAIIFAKKSLERSNAIYFSCLRNQLHTSVEPPRKYFRCVVLVIFTFLWWSMDITLLEQKLEHEKNMLLQNREITPENLHYLLLNFLYLVWRGLISLCNICEVCSILNFLIAKEFVQRFVKKSL